MVLSDVIGGPLIRTYPDWYVVVHAFICLALLALFALVVLTRSRSETQVTGYRVELYRRVMSFVGARATPRETVRVVHTFHVRTLAEAEDRVWEWMQEDDSIIRGVIVADEGEFYTIERGPREGQE